MTALEYANERENVCIFMVGNGFPTGITVAWIPGETELPFDLDEVEGEIDEEGQFNATNIKYGNGLWDWNFNDWNGNLISRIELYVNASTWAEEYADWCNG